MNPKLSTQPLGEPPAPQDPQDPHAELVAWARRVLPEMKRFGFFAGHTDDLARILARVDGEGETTRAEWVVQDGRIFYEDEVWSYKSTAGEWGFGYGTNLKGILAIETLVIGFDSEEEAFTAAEAHCRESAEESACEVHE